MQDIVALSIKLKSGKLKYLMTWGRIQDKVNPQPLETLIYEKAKKIYFDDEIESVRLCDNLQEASKEPYFYEALFSFSQTKIPFGEDYKDWVTEINKLMNMGKEIYLL